jgi:hypothetical protein
MVYSDLNWERFEFNLAKMTVREAFSQRHGSCGQDCAFASYDSLYLHARSICALFVGLSLLFVVLPDGEEGMSAVA